MQSNELEIKLKKVLTQNSVCGNILMRCFADIAQEVERNIGSVEVTGSTPVISFTTPGREFFLFTREFLRLHGKIKGAEKMIHRVKTLMMVRRDIS